MKYLCNVISLQMFNLEKRFVLNSKPVGSFPADVISAIGHTDTAAVLGVECNRMNVHLNPEDELYVAQLTGGRLPEGSTTLPEGFKFKIAKITVKYLD